MSKPSSTISLLLDLTVAFAVFNLRCTAEAFEMLADHLADQDEDEELVPAEPNTHRAGDLEVSALTAVAEDDADGCDVPGCRMCQFVTDGAR